MRLLPLILLLAAAPPGQAADFDVVIRHGRIVDGTGRPAFAGDLAIKDGRIAAVGDFAGTGRTEIDAAGRVVAPGFIDVHTHAEDIAELPAAENFIRMGVTTIVTGNCGTSQLDVAGFFAGLTHTPVAVNVATLIGHGTVRSEVMGNAVTRPPTPDELARMQGLVERAMQAGAVGLSTGLIYVPGTFATTDEIVALAKVAARHGGIYASHMRHENWQILAALDELTTVARQAHIPAEVSHIKLGGPAAWGRADEILAYLDRARAAGLVITQDEYLYTAASTSINSRIPEDALAGGREQFRARLADPAAKARIVADMKAALGHDQRSDFSYAVIADFPPDPRVNGKTIPQAARLMRGGDSIDDQIETILDIEARGGASAVFHGMSETDVQRFLTDPQTMVASDSGVRKFGEGMPHPRGYGNNARVLGHYVRELKLLSLEEAVRKMTTLPARTFHLGQRGELKPGDQADVVIFDPATVTDNSTYDDPHHYATGFTDVLVNGVPVIRAGALTGVRPGTPVKRE